MSLILGSGSGAGARAGLGAGEGFFGSAAGFCPGIAILLSGLAACPLLSPFIIFPLANMLSIRPIPLPFFGVSLAVSVSLFGRSFILLKPLISSKRPLGASCSGAGFSSTTGAATGVFAGTGTGAGAGVGTGGGAGTGACC